VLAAAAFSLTNGPVVGIPFVCGIALTSHGTKAAAACRECVPRAFQQCSVSLKTPVASGTVPSCAFHPVVTLTIVVALHLLGVLIVLKVATGIRGVRRQLLFGASERSNCRRTTRPVWRFGHVKHRHGDCFGDCSSRCFYLADGQPLPTAGLPPASTPW
jgi:hypothetical protein